MALTRRNENQRTPLARTVPATQALAHIIAANTFQAFRADIVARDFPNLATNQVTQGAQLIANGLTDMAEQTRLQRESEEARRDRESNKVPEDLFGTGLPKLMRWVHAPTGAHLPPVYTMLAKCKKGERRRVIQDQVNEAMEILRYPHEFPVTTKLATKIVDLEWSSRLVDDLSLGLSIFTLGWVVEEDAEIRKTKNAQADSVYLGHAQPSLSDAAAILDSTDDVHIPRTFSQLRYGVEQCHAVCYVLLGPRHPITTQHHVYREMLISQETELDRVMPRNPQQKYLVPALLARRLQIDVNVWLQEQRTTNSLVPVPAFTDVFQDIRRQKDWAPEFPVVYLQWSSIIETDQHSLASGLTSPSTGTGGSTNSGASPSGNASNTGGSGGTTSGTGTNAQTRQEPAFNRSVNPAYHPFRTLGLKTAEVKRYCEQKTIPWPKNDANVDFCASYHIKEMCNTRCRSAADHKQHTPAEDARLVGWCTQHYKIE
jgi:hypothetical protein